MESAELPATATRTPTSQSAYVLTDAVAPVRHSRPRGNRSGCMAGLNTTDDPHPLVLAWYGGSFALQSEIGKLARLVFADRFSVGARSALNELIKCAAKRAFGCVANDGGDVCYGLLPPFQELTGNLHSTVQ